MIYYLDSYLDKHTRKALELFLVCKENAEAHHEANDEKYVGNHEPGNLHEDRSETEMNQEL